MGRSSFPATDLSMPLGRHLALEAGLHTPLGSWPRNGLQALFGLHRALPTGLQVRLGLNEVLPTALQVRATTGAEGEERSDLEIRSDSAQASWI